MSNHSIDPEESIESCMILTNPGISIIKIGRNFNVTLMCVDPPEGESQSSAAGFSRKHQRENLDFIQRFGIRAVVSIVPVRNHGAS